MQIIIFGATVAAFFGFIFFAGWIFVKSVLMMFRRTRKAGAVISSACATAVRATSVLVMKCKLEIANYLAARAASRSEQTVIMQESTEISTVQVEASADFGPDVDWSVYDTPAYLRKGNVLVW